MPEMHSIDLVAVRRAFPPSIPFPKLLEEWCGWLDGRAIGDCGGFLLGPMFPDDAPLRHGCEFFDDLALFMRLPEGSCLGLWNGGGMEPCVVGIGSEGDLEVLAPDLTAFLAKLSLRRFAAGRWTDLEPWEEDRTADLREWLESRALRPVENHADRTMPLRSFQDFVMQKEQAAADRWAEDPYLRELERLLAPHRPDAANPWLRSVFVCTMAGAIKDLRLLGRPQAVLHEDAIIVLEEIRERMLLQDRKRGLWTQADLFMGSDGRLQPTFHFMRHPRMADVLVPVDELHKDLARAPREPRLVPAWR